MQTITVSRDDDIYEAFADIAQTPDGVLVCTYRESMGHSSRPFSRVIVRRSVDRGLTWGPRQVVLERSAEETARGLGRLNCSRIAVCADGTLLLMVDLLLRESDFVTVHVNLSDATRGLVDARALSLMKPTAYLVNVARGPVIDEGALVEALRERRIAGAGIDVYEVEPPSAENPLWELDNVVVSPHRAGFSHESVHGCSMVAEDVVRVLRGEEPRFPVA